MKALDCIFNKIVDILPKTENNKKDDRFNKINQLNQVLQNYYKMQKMKKKI